MKSFLIFAGVLGVAATMAMAAPTCTTGSYASYEALTAGCTIDNLLFSNFHDIESASGTAVALTAASITVSPDFFALDEGLQFSAPWAVGDLSSLDSNLQFTVQTVNSSTTLEDISLSYNGAPAGTGTSGVTETYCVGSTAGTAHCPTPLQTIAVSGNNSGPITQFYASTTALSVVKDISLTGGTDGSSSISLVDNNYSQTGAVPEPMSFVLLGSGLLAVGLLRKRNRS